MVILYIRESVGHFMMIGDSGRGRVGFDSG